MIGTDLDYAQTCKYAVICEGQVSPSEGIIESVTHRAASMDVSNQLR